MSADILGCYNGGGEVVLLASGGQRPGMPLDILPCTGKHLQQITVSAKMSIVRGWETSLYTRGGNVQSSSRIRLTKSFGLALLRH